ncbi:hypothetical protein [Rhizobium gallicum]|uniref:hypothetical protein n=1 Tax=Rhizobium gallicum TaxID=56730 RepID=UPI001EF7F7AA|nr:hypothetical protein [Rhizobium gallicum]ULJ70643.1 hypothetical protein L2W42_11795 [Rhizobium gallicum]
MSVKRNPRLRAALLKAASDLGDVKTVYARAILALWESGDPEYRMLARILSGKTKSGVTARFLRRRGHMTTGPGPVVGRDGLLISRREIASAVYEVLGKPHLGERIKRAGLKTAIGKVAKRLDITDKVVRDCFGQYRRMLALEESFPLFPEMTAK